MVVVMSLHLEPHIWSNTTKIAKNCWGTKMSQHVNTQQGGKTT